MENKPIRPATLLPWHVADLLHPDHFGGECPEIHDAFGRVATVYGEGAEAARQAPYIAEAATAYPRLLADNERLRKANDEFSKEHSRLATERAELEAALQGLFEHCAMIHKHWGEGDNTKQASAAQDTARALLRKLGAA